jgi:lipopolysaccharide heptosyltransferase I
MPDGTDNRRGNLLLPSDFAHRSPRILITRLSAIGDCILTMPLAVALREAFPQAFIVWAVEGVSGTMIEGHPAIDLAIRLPRRFARSPLTLWHLRQQLRSLRLDITIDPQGLSKSALVAWLSGARRRIGFARPVGREISPWLNTELVESRDAHVVHRYLELLRPLGVPSGPARFEFPVDEQARTKMTSALVGLGLKGRFAILNPGAGWESKRWPAERYAEVAREVDRRWQIPSLVVWAGNEERAWADQIARSAAHSAHVAPATTLLELAAVLSQATTFVGSDTGPLHMAAALGIRCVGIYGPTNPDTCGPYGRGHQIVRPPYSPEMPRQGRRGTNEAMRQIPAAWVVEACNRILAGSQAESAA